MYDRHAPTISYNNDLSYTEVTDRIQTIASANAPWSSRASIGRRLAGRALDFDPMLPTPRAVNVETEPDFQNSKERLVGFDPYKWVKSRVGHIHAGEFIHVQIRENACLLVRFGMFPLRPAVYEKSSCSNLAWPSGESKIVTFSGR